MSQIINRPLRPWLLAMLILLAVGLVLYFKPLSGSYIFAGPDTLSPSATSAGLRALEKETGDVPLWMPWLFSGMPTIHSFTYISILYLPNAVLGLLAPILPLFSGYLLHLVFAGLGCFVLLRRMGGSFAASLLGGTGFMLMPYINTMLVHGHGSQMMTLAYLPWVIWAVLRLYDRTTFTSAALLALLVGLQLQRGHAQIAYYTLLLLGLFFLVMVVKSWRDSERGASRNWRFILLFALAMVVGFGLATSLFLPVMNYTPYSIRGGGMGGGTGFEYATQWSFSLGETVTFLLPSFYGFGGVTYWGDMPFTDYPNYMGILLLLLAVWAVAARHSWFVWTLAAGGFLAYLLSLGHNFFLYKLFYNLFPYFNKFRVPVMLLVLTQFSVVVLAGIGLDSWLSWLTDRKVEQARRILLWIAGGLVALALLFLISASMLEGTFPAARGVPAQMAPRIESLRLSLIRTDALLLLVIGGLAIGCLYFWRRGRLPHKWLLVGLVALSAADLGRIDRMIIEPSRESLRAEVLRPRAYVQRYLSRDQVLDFLSSDTSTYRIFPLGRQLEGENRWAAAGLESIVGYHAAKLANYDRFMQATGFRSEGILRMLNVKYLVSRQRFSDPRFREVFVGNLYTEGSYQPAAVYEFTAFLERAWFPRRIEVKTTVEETFELLRNPGYDPEEVVYIIQADVTDTLAVPPASPGLAEGATPGLATARAGGSGRVLEAAWQADHLRLKVETDAPAFLVVSEIYYPEGWLARVDGKPAPIHEVNTILRGIMVLAGTHEITMDFEPADVRLGRLISSLSLLLIVLGFIPAAVILVRSRMSRPENKSLREEGG
ncbi:MAG: YfhO family protein [Calditrichaeota bacterium]|nr:YfhO family protein [Calditrichota bacterium]